MSHPPTIRSLLTAVIYETIYDGQALQAMRRNDAMVPITVKISDTLADVRGYLKSHHSSMTRQTSKGLNEVITILEAVHRAEREDAALRMLSVARPGQIGPRPALRMVGADRAIIE